MKKIQIFLLYITILFLFTSCKKGEKQNASESETKVCLQTVEQEGAKEPELKNILFVTKGDDIILTEKDNEEIKAVSGVTGTEFYGGAARISCFYRKEKDYTTENIVKNPEYPYDYPPEMINGENCTRYIGSAKNLSANDLSSGTLPSGMDEIVLYSSDKSVIGKNLKMYFCNYYDFAEYHFDIGYLGDFVGNPTFSFIAKEMKITGILKEQTTQVYFSDSFCDMMNKSMDVMYPQVSAQCFDGEEGIGIQEIDGKVGPEGKYKLTDIFYDKLPWKGDYISINRGDYLFELVYVDEKLGNQEVGISKYWIQNKMHTAQTYGTEKGAIYDFIALSYYAQWRQEPKGLLVPESEGCLWEDPLSFIGYSFYSKDSVSSTGVITDKSEIIQKISSTQTESGDYTLAVNQELFDRIYNYEGTKIIAVYVEQGEEVQVMEVLLEQGYKEYSLPESIWIKVHTEGE
ncbi:MAG: hypothetical protein HFH63_13135 [Lachnospiraceae bacterium]|nr:hypothetical protein [Lachnospiraceae bacterium]